VTALFSQVLNMSLTGSAVILIVLLVRFALKKLPKIYSYALWAVVLFRLICPLSLSSPVSLLDPFQPEITEVSQTVNVVSYIPEAAIPSAEPAYSYFAPSVSQVENIIAYENARRMSPMQILPFVWLLGTGILLLVSLIQYLQLRSKLVGTVQIRKNVYLTDHLETAFVLGILIPKIFIPAGVPVQERKYIIAHERHHIRRGDHIFKLLGFAALCIHWFNPLVWVAFVLSGKDMEMSCDEAVIRKMGLQIRADYAAALLKLTAHRQVVPGMPLAFGEGDTKGRVKNMAGWRKPKTWISVICVLVCIAVLAACALNPADKTADEQSHIHFGEVSFALPDGFGIEEGSVPDSKGLSIIKDGMVVGGLYELEYPDQEFGSDWEWAQALDIPENVPDERLMMYVHYSAKEEGSFKLYAAYGNNGIEETLHYLMEGTDHIYGLWFDMRFLTESEKVLILNAANGKESDKIDSPYVLLDPFNPLKPHPDGISGRLENNGDYSLIHLDNADRIIGGIRVRPTPEGFLRNDYFSQEFLTALGVEEASNDTLGYYSEGNATEMDFEYFSDVPPGQERSVHTRHRFYVTRDDYIIDVWCDLLATDHSYWDWMMEALDIPEIKRIRSGQQSYEETIPQQLISYPFQIKELPDGISFDILGKNSVLFVDDKNVYGGVDIFTIPEGVYDPVDTSWFWLEKMGLPDFENPELSYIGSMTAGDNGWLAEFASDVPEGTPKTVHRRHYYRVVGDQLCDIWMDMMLLDYMQAEDISRAISFDNLSSIPSQGNSPEEVAFEKTASIMEAVSNGSCHILSVQENDGNEGPKGYQKNFLYHEGNYLYTSQVLTAGENVTEAGEYYNRYGLLIVDDTFYSNSGFQGNPDEIIWKETAPVDPEVPWLGNRIWNKSFATYMDTLTDENGTCYMFRYDKPFEDQEDFSDCYFVSFNYTPQGEFRNVKLQVNLFQENGFTVTETIQSMDETHIANIIEAEYNAAIS